MTKMSTGNPPSFWRWFFRGTGGKQGYRRLINVWLIVHIAVGYFFAKIVIIDLATASDSVLLPLAAVLVGLSFTWAGNAQALLQASEIEKMADFHPGGFPEYAFAFQTAILCILVTLVAWALAGFQVFDKVWPTTTQIGPYFGVKWFLFTLSSATLRECWHIVLGAQWMLLMRYR